MGRWGCTWRCRTVPPAPAVTGQGGEARAVRTRQPRYLTTRRRRRTWCGRAAQPSWSAAPVDAAAWQLQGPFGVALLWPAAMRQRQQLPRRSRRPSLLRCRQHSRCRRRCCAAATTARTRTAATTYYPLLPHFAVAMDPLLHQYYSITP
jgi:hypothetical protein